MNKQWFTDRINKRIYMGKSICWCDTCMMMHNYGTVLMGEEHAEGLYRVARDLDAEFYDEKPFIA